MAIEKHVIQLTAKDQASPVFQKVGKSAEDAGKKAEKATKDWGNAATATGAAIGTLVGVTSALGQAHQSESAQLRALSRAYGDTADDIDAMAQKYQSLGIASDDSVRIAALGAQSLAKNYGLTTEEIQQLIERSADLSAVTFDQYGNQLELADVMQRVSGAIRGEGEAAEVLGVAMGDQALAARAAADGLTGWNTTMTESEKAQYRLKVLLEDTSSAQGAAGERADTLAGKMNALKLQVLDAGATFGGALGPIGEASSVLGDMALIAPVAGGALGKLAGSAGALSLAMGPVGIGLVAVASAAAVAFAIFNEDTEKVGITMDEATGAVQSFNEAIGQLGQQGVSTAITENAAALVPVYQEMGVAIAKASEEAVQLEKDMYLIAPSQKEATAAAKEHMAALQGQILTQEEYADVQQDTIDLLRHQGINSEQVTARVNELWAAYDAGSMSADQLAWNLNWLNENSASYGLTLEELANQQLSTATTAIDGMTESLYGGVAALSELDKYAGDDTGIGKVRGASVDATKSLEQMAAESAELDKQLGALAQTLQRDLAGAAGASYQRVVGFTSGMVSAISTSKEWADALIAPVGVWSEMDNMLANGTIDIEDYNEAQQAQIDITDALTRSTEAANEIQIKQADTVAEGADATADYLENLADLDEAEQAVALAWADSDVAGRAMEVANLAAEFGNMNTAQQSAFEDMVTSAAATDPALAGVLEDLGLIKADVNDPTGWALTIDESEASASLDDVVVAIDNLTAAILGVPDVGVNATLDDSSFWSRFNALPDSHWINVYTEWHGSIPQLQTGGVVGWDGDAAALGIAGRGNAVLVGEAGPEIVHLPGGSRVEPNSSARYNMGKGGGDIVINGPITIMANDTQSFVRQLRQSAVTLERR